MQVDISGCITYINEAGCQLLQTTPVSMIGQTMLSNQWNTIDENGKPYSDDQLPVAKALREGVPMKAVQCGLQFEDSILWLSVFIAPLHDLSGELTGAMVNFVEVVSKKDTGKILLQREQRLHSIANSQSSYLIRTNLSGHFTYVNNAFLNRYDYREDEVIDKAFSFITDPDDVGPCINVAKQCVRRPGRSQTIQIRGVNKQRDYFWTEWEFVGVADITGQVTEIQGVGRDISSEKRIESLLIETSQMAHVGGWELTSLTNNLSWTDETYRIHDIEPGTAVSLRKSIYFYHVDHQPIIKKAIRELVAKGKSFDLELKMVTPNNREVWVRTQGQREASRDNFIRIYGVIQDITERKLAEERIMSNNDKLTKINRELDRFVYSASHDLRAPLTSIIGLINLSKMEDNSPVIGEYLDLMKRSADKLDSFIQDLTNFSRNARTEIKYERVDFQEMVDAIFEQHKFMDNSKEANMQADIEQKVPFFSDNNRLQVVFSNIISNAVKYNSHLAEKSLVTIGIKVTTKEATIRIADNGMGIAQEHLEKIFEMFYRATDQKQGSGLGLYIVKETIEKLAGKVDVASEVGVGTSFTIRVPNKPPEKK